MAIALYNLGRWCFRRRRLVTLVWLLALIGGGVAAGTLSGPTSEQFTVPGTESQQALDVLAERFPGTGVDGATARVVFTTADGDLRTGADRRAIEDVVRGLGSGPQVGSVTDPFDAAAVSPDGRTAYAEVSYVVQAAQLTDAARDGLRAATEPAREAGLGVEFGGDATRTQQEQSFAEVIGVGVAAVVLILTLGSLVAAGLPLLNAIVAVGMGMMGITVATGFVDLSASASTLALMLGLAVSVDYALFIVFRYRHECRQGRDREEAIGRASGTAGSAVVFAGLTVVIALSALAVVGIPFLTAMGLAAAGTVAVAVAVALTLLPAMLGFAGQRGQRAHLPGLRGREQAAQTRPTWGARWVATVLRHRAPAAAASVLVLLSLAIPALDLRLGLPGADTMPSDTTQRKAYDELAAGFGAGFNGPLLIAVEPQPGTDLPDAAETVHDRLEDIPGVVAVTDPTVSPDASAAIVTVIPASGPTAAETTALVNRLRGQDGEAITDEAGVDIAVTGATALGIDVSDKLNSALLPYLLVVGGLASLLLLLVFRSLIVPVKATLGFLLSVAATFGAVVAVFQWGWFAGPLGVSATGPIVSFLPIFLIGLIFGLAMDYEVFLVTRMREEFVHGAEPSRAVAIGFEAGARVVTAAAVIMISVFGGFFLAPEPIIKSFGFALAVGVALDAFVVRMTLVPAVLSLLGRAAWWLPRRLDAVLPDVDVEGERLRATLDRAHPPEPAPVLHGRVGTTEGPVPVGAVVTLLDLTGRPGGIAVVARDGSYRCRLPWAGTYLVLAQAPQHRPEVRDVEVGPGSVRHDVVLMAEPPGPARGPRDEPDRWAQRAPAVSSPPR